MSDRIIGRRVVRLGTVASTMEEAARLAAGGEEEGTAVVAVAQTAGRGRAGRRWIAPADTAILCSVLLRPTVPATRLAVLPLVTGVAVAEAIEKATGLSCRLKWPNDVWAGATGRKISGILVTSRTGVTSIEYVITGIGINVNMPEQDLPPGGTSLLAELGHAVDQEAVFAALLNRLDLAYQEFVTTGGHPNLDGWRARAALVGEVITVEDGDRVRGGRLQGIDDDGALLLRAEPGTLERIVAGELTRGPRLAPLR